MKKLLSFSLALVMTACMLSTFTAFAADGVRGDGDVNGDGKLSIVDVVMTRSYIVGTYGFTTKQFDSANMNGDSKVNIVDVVMMRKIIVTGSGNTEQTSGVKLSTSAVTLQKGACAIVYIATDEADLLQLDYKSDYFEAHLGRDDENGMLGIAIFANKNSTAAVTSDINVYLKGNEDKKETLKVTVTNNTAISTYVNNPAVPDFGSYCQITPAEVGMKADFYIYAVGDLIDVYGKDKTLDYYEGFTSILEAFGFIEQFSYVGANGGEVVAYRSEDGKLAVEYGVNVSDIYGEVIIVSVSKVAVQ